MLRDVHEFSTVAAAARYLGDDEVLPTGMAWMFRTHVLDHLPDSRNTELLRSAHRYAEDIDPVGWSAGRINGGLLKVFKDELDQMVREGTMVLRPVDQRSLAKMETEGAFGDPHFVVQCGVLIAQHDMMCSYVSESQLGEFDEAVQAIPLLKALLDRERWRRVRNGEPAEYDDRRLR